MASSNSDNVDRVDSGSLPSGMRSFLGHVYTHIQKCCAEVEYRSGEILFKPVVFE